MLKFRTHINDQNKDWITFIHGFGGSSRIWYKQIRQLGQYYNLLLIDLRGHGMSKNIYLDSNYNLSDVCEDIISVLKSLKIQKSHFIGISFGSLLILKLFDKHKNYIQKTILAGAITSFTDLTRILLWCLSFLKYILPNHILYKLFAHIIMPKSNHKESRLMFIKEAKKLDRKVFNQWFRLIPNLKKFILDLDPNNFNKPILFISGQEDFLFSNEVNLFTLKNKYFSYCCIKGAGHVVNIDKPYEFNKIFIEFLNSKNNTVK